MNRAMPATTSISRWRYCWGLQTIIGYWTYREISMQILDLHTADEQQRQQAAALLVEGFRENWPAAWPTLAAALLEVDQMLDPERICRVALAEDGTVLGWIGGIPEYDGNVWELHPLVVAPTQQRRGIGRALVRDFEQQCAARGGWTIRLGSDDENNQ